jgi:hypothetical protein
MPPRAKPIMKTPAKDIWDELCAYAVNKQAIPVRNALYTLMLQKYDKSNRQYLYLWMYKEDKSTPRSVGTFDYYFDRLRFEGYVTVYDDTGAIKVNRLRISEAEDEPEQSVAEKSNRYQPDF